MYMRSFPGDFGRSGRFYRACRLAVVRVMGTKSKFVLGKLRRYNRISRQREKEAIIGQYYWWRKGRGRREAPTLRGLSNYSQDHPGSYDQPGHVISTGVHEHGRL
jgi:hypothetical protein